MSSRPAHGAGEPTDKKTAGLEVEVKLRLADSASYAALAQVLLPCFRQAHEQENFFFDGSAKELSSQRCVLRVRFFNKDRKAVITVKGKQVLKDGVGTAPEEEEDVDPATARTFLSNPQALLELDSPLLRALRDQYQLSGLVCLGGFDNLRMEYLWRGHLLELDQTSYPWGALHELECETSDPAAVRAELEKLLSSHGVEYSYTKKSKFANFVDKSLE